LNKKLNKLAFLIIPMIIGLSSKPCFSNSRLNFHQQIKQDLNVILVDISNHYVYLEEKNVDLACVREKYSKKINSLNTRNDTVIFFENLLNEFYDSHVHLNTNTKSSYRLSSPIYTSFNADKYIVSSVWSSQLENIESNILGAEILAFNQQTFDQEIKNFPILCADKNIPKVKEWIANKILAGKYNQKRKLSLKLVNSKIIHLDLDQLKLKANDTLLSAHESAGYGVIRINNSLGNNHLIAEFDKALDSLMDTKGLILDLRNTVDGGNSYVARGIMGRFIGQKMAYQNHRVMESYIQDVAVERSWIEYVSPREKYYAKPLVILAGRWTGSMGEGITIGFDGMNRAEIVGTEMERLAGAIEGFSFKHSTFGYMFSTEKLFHVNGSAREDFVPVHYVEQNQVAEDQMMEMAFKILNNNR
jgi:hypothetical protein